MITTDNIVWKKEKPHPSDTIADDTIANRVFVRGDSAKATKIGHHYYYQFDSIRMYVPVADTILNILVKRGFIPVKYFFVPKMAYDWRDLAKLNPIKSTINGWSGYNFIIYGLKEIKTVRFPYRIKRKTSMYKVYDFLYTAHGQGYPNSSVYQIELENNSYKCTKRNITFDQFLQHAKLVSFLRVGMQI